MYRSKVETAAVTWREARMNACAALMGDKVVWADLGAAETALTEAVKAMLDQEAERARLAARPKTFVVYGMKYGARHEEKTCTLEEAIDEACGAAEWGSWYPEGVRTLQRELILNEEQLYVKIHERN